MNLFARIRAHGITSEELAACEVAATMMARSEVPADATLKERLPDLHWRREVTLLALVLDIAKADGWGAVEAHRPGRPSRALWGRSRSKLDEDDVREIRKLRGTLRAKEIAERFGVSVSIIYDIHSRKSWRDVA